MRVLNYSSFEMAFSTKRIFEVDTLLTEAIDDYELKFLSTLKLIVFYNANMPYLQDHYY